MFFIDIFQFSAITFRLPVLQRLVDVENATLHNVRILKQDIVFIANFEEKL